MKVRIYNYAPWLNTSRLEAKYLEARHNKPSWELKSSDETKIDKIVIGALDKYQSYVLAPINTLLNTLHSWRGQYHVRIDKFDTWNMDTTLSYIILPMLEKLRLEKNGAPFVDDTDVPLVLYSTTVPAVNLKDGDVDGNHFKRWDYVLDEMIFAFRSKSSADDWQDKYFVGKSDYESKPIDVDGNSVPKEGAEFYQMVKTDKHTMVVDWAGLEEEEIRIANGFRLFGKYYQNLWD